MSELAKSHIDIIDESAYAAGVSPTIPLIVFATGQDKVIDTAGNVALGTIKEVANEVLMITSRKDCIDKFGTPSFTTIDGTVQQGDELNEIGLYALYDALGSASVAYALRADINLTQLQPDSAEPVGKAENGTQWFDLTETSYGMFRSNGNTRPSLAWDKIDYVLIPSEKQIADGAPMSGIGKNGDIAIVTEDNVNKFFENVNSKWFLIGSEEWKTALGTVPILHYNTHTQTPSGTPAGSIWIKTTEPNFGSSYLLKTYNSTSDYWSVAKLNMFGTAMEAERVLSSTLKDGSMIVRYDTSVSTLAENMIKVYREGEMNITATKMPTTVPSSGLEGSAFTITSLVKGVVKDITVNITGTSSITNVQDLISKFVTETNNQLARSGATDILALIDENGNFVINSSMGKAIKLTDSFNNPLNTIFGIASDEYSLWEDASYIADSFEPTTDPDFGTLWFNDELNVDIMINDNGKWVGYKNRAGNEDASIYVQPSQPMTPKMNDIWVNSAHADYPRIYKYVEGTFELVDNTDQLTSDGIIFMDARENAGYMHDFSTEPEKLLISDYVDPNAPNPQTYSDGILLFNTMFSTNNVKAFTEVYEDYVAENELTYVVGNSEEFQSPGTIANPKTTRWSTASGNALDGSGLFGKKAQRSMVVDAMAGAIKSNDDIRSQDYDFFFASCPGYPELDDELISLNADKKEMFYIISDTPKALEPNGNAIFDWGTNANNAPSHGSEGRILMNAYVTRQYPPVGITSNVDGEEVSVPTSVAKMRNLLVLPRGRFAAGTQYGQVINLSSVGYITAENEYASVVVRDGIGEIITAQSMNPIMPQRGTGLLFWGENTENPYTSSLSDEHAILTILRMKRQISEAIMPFYFQPNTESLRKDFDAVLRSILSDFVSRDELYDFTLVTDRSVNTSERIGRKELWANIAIEIVKGVEQIYIPIRVVSTGSL